jgi:hypothetical protein
MLDKKTSKALRARFEHCLGEWDWKFVADQLLDQYLARNCRDLQSDGPAMLRQDIESFEMLEVQLAGNFFGKKSADCLVIGDDLGIVRGTASGAKSVLYEKESIAFFNSQGMENAALLDDLDGWGKEKYRRILFLYPMEALMNVQNVQNLRTYLKTAYDALGNRGRIMILDRIQYQDDFVCQYVDLGAEIETVERYGKNSFILVVAP